MLITERLSSMIAEDIMQRGIEEEQTERERELRLEFAALRLITIS